MEITTWKLQDYDHCIVCTEKHTIIHMLLECSIVKTVWLTLQYILKFKITIYILKFKITKNTIICGVKDEVINFLISLNFFVFKNISFERIMSLKTFLLKKLCFRRLVYLKLNRSEICGKIFEFEELILKYMA